MRNVSISITNAIFEFSTPKLANPQIFMSPPPYFVLYENDNVSSSDSVVCCRAEGPSGFSIPRLRGVPSQLLLVFLFSGDEVLE